MKYIYFILTSLSTGHPSRRENEFKKPANALQNGRVHHRYAYNKVLYFRTIYNI